jgi:hypothetical protein
VGATGNFGMAEFVAFNVAEQVEGNGRSQNED